MDRVSPISEPVVGTEVASRASPTAVSLDEARARWKDVLTAEGKSIRTIASYDERVAMCAEFAGWSVVSHVQYEQAMAFLAARMRNDHGGKAWDTAACRATVSSLKSFGKFLYSSGLVRPNPFGEMTLPKKRAGRHKHPFAVEEAGRMVHAAFVRQQRDRRAKGHAALVWYTLFMTGLRHSEVQAACKNNPYGGLKWRDVTLHGEFPGIWTDKKWIGNKSKTRDWIPLHPRLVELLAAHRESVMHRPEDAVFPVWPIRATWEDDRAQAGLPVHDDDGRALSVHATRATFSTWVGKLVLPEGLRERLTRHHGSLAEWVYGEREKKEMAEAVKQLPDVWPDQGGPQDSNTKISRNGPQGLDKPEPKSYVRHGTQHEHSPQKSSDDGPAACQRVGSESRFGSGTREGRLSSQPDLRAENAPSRIRKSG